MVDRLGRDFNVRLQVPGGKEHAPGPLAAPGRDAGASRFAREPRASAEGQAHAPLSPRAENADDSSVVVRHDDGMSAQEKGREQPVQAGIGWKVSHARPRKRRRDPDGPLTRREIVAATVAVVVIGLGFAALLPWILTRPGVDPAQPRITSPAPVEPPQIESSGAVEPVPALRPALPVPSPPAPVPNDSSSVAKASPVLDNTGSVPSAQQAGGRVAGANAVVPGTGNAAASRTALTAEEKAAVERGLKELGNTAANNTPLSPALNGFALTETEKAAVERGLRELEKAERARQ